MRKLSMILGVLLMAVVCSATAQPTIHVDPPKSQGQSQLQQTTAEAAIRDYLESWQGLQSALYQNRPDLLDAFFVGDACDKLAAAIREQAALDIRTRYTDRSHHLQIVFYSPEGLSIELIDDVEYEVELFDHGKSQSTQPMHARYIAVLTPSESRWRVRMMQAGSQ